MPKKMKIVIATEAYWPLIDGGAVAEHNLTLALVKRGHEVHVIAPSKDRSDYTEEDQGSTIHRLSAYPVPLAKNDHRLAWNPSKKINKILDEFQPDLVHLHNPFPIGKAVLKYCRKNNIPTVATNHWLPENITTFISKMRFMNSLNFIVKLNWAFIAKFHNKCHFVTSPTQTAIDLMVQNGLTAPCRPVSNGVETSVFKPGQNADVLRSRLNIPQNKPIALYAGRLSGEKCVDDFINAIPDVLKSVDAHFIVGGNGREKDNLMALTHTLNIQDHVTFPGFLDDDEFPLLYNLGDVFIMPSICELQSITTLEALATGLPVIAANKYALPELVHSGKNGYLFEPRNITQLSEHMVTVLKDKSARQAMSEHSLAIVQEHALENTVSDYESIYRSLVT
ncbi:MAG: glycosyltransferase [Candidatus Margulisbacteria bacterium]|nr:glycosyltransferase [Candidatus Margulisiibacteriota bacterium]